jgi:hypothetical protein
MIKAAWDPISLENGLLDHGIVIDRHAVADLSLVFLHFVAGTPEVQL